SRTVRTAPAGDGRGTGRPARTDRSEAARPAADQRGKTPDGAAPAPSRGDEGVFSRVAENARRLSSLFGGPEAGRTGAGGTGGSSRPAAPTDETRAENARRPRKSDGEERTAPAADRADGAGAGAGAGKDTDKDAKPALQLDHGTGEQDRLPRTRDGR